jgi:hypothetical protein
MTWRRSNLAFDSCAAAFNPRSSYADLGPGDGLTSRRSYGRGSSRAVMVELLGRYSNWTSWADRLPSLDQTGAHRHQGPPAAVGSRGACPKST